MKKKIPDLSKCIPVEYIRTGIDEQQWIEPPERKPRIKRFKSDKLKGPSEGGQ
jgi:hypothetical protein